MTFPLVVTFDESLVEPIFSNKQLSIFLFRDDEKNQSDYVKVFKEAAEILKHEGILFVETDSADGLQAKLAEFLGIGEKKLP